MRRRLGWLPIAAAACLLCFQTATAAAEIDDDDCGLYMAPSFIRGAGLGLYTAKDIDKGQILGEQDVVIPIADRFKTLPYKGNHRFLSWLGYVWPAAIDTFYPSYHDESEPELPAGRFWVDEGLNAANTLSFHDEESEKISALAPGIASLANSHLGLQNVRQTTRTTASPDSVQFQSTVNIQAGSELFLFYGDEWHVRREWQAEQPVHYQPPYVNFEDISDEAEKRANQLQRQDTRLVEQQLEHVRLKTEKKLDDNDSNDVRQELLGKMQQTGQRMEQQQRALRLGHNEEEEEETADLLMGWWQQQLEEEEDEDEEEDEEDEDDDAEPRMHVPTRDISQLRQHGICVDRLTSGPSTIPNAGRGAFAQRPVAAGSVISASPLLALKRDDLEIRRSFHEEGQYRAQLSSEVAGQELLLNYCFGHAQSDLLLVPYGPVVNWINHDSQAPNAVIRWHSNPNYRDPQDWLQLHPLDVLDHSGKLMMEFVALRDLEPGDEILIDYGREWEAAWQAHAAADNNDEEEERPFRHEIGVPDGFYPETWIQKPTSYQIASIDHLEPGELVPLTWEHNGQPIADNMYAIGLPKGFTKHFQRFVDEKGLRSLYEKLLLAETPVLKNNEWYVFQTADEEEWFAHSFENEAFKFNMHYIAAWDEAARITFLKTMGEAGFGTVLQSVGTHFGLSNMTCIHASLMGATECENSRRHADVYSTNGRGFNIVFPIVLVDGSKAELDLITQNPNVEVSVNYKEDIAYVLSDFGYHKTSPHSYGDTGDIRIVVGTYCAQMDETNREMLRHIYEGEIVAPFADQFYQEPAEVHWTSEGGECFPK